MSDSVNAFFASIKGISFVGTDDIERLRHKKTEGVYLDRWAALFEISRLDNESDDDLRVRVVKEFNKEHENAL